MGKIRTWAKGYIEIQVWGNRPERFLSLLNHKQIHIWEVEPYEQGYRFKLERCHVRELDAMRKKTGCNIKVLNKYGLPFFLFRYRKRKFFVLGLLLCGILIYVCSLFIWDINVDGTYFYTDEQIKTRIEEAYVTVGQRKSQVDCNWLEEQLRQDFPEISWVSCEILGTQLNVEIKETLEGTETINEDTGPQDIVAAKDGVVVEMITRSGTPVVKIGQSISKGDILISGVINIYDDFDEVIETDYVAADGDVIGETVYQYEDSFEMQYYEKEYTGSHQSAFTIEIVNWVQELHLPWKKFNNFDVVEENHKLRLGHTYYLPIGFTVKERREYTPVLCTYTEEEAMERAQARLQRFLDTLSEKEVEIMENNVTIEIRDGICYAAGTVVVWERMGYGRPLTIPEEPAPGEDTGAVEDSSTSLQ